MNVRYAILQKSLEIPPVSALRKAFKTVRCLTDVDAHTLANDAYGILVKNLSAEDASTLHLALKSQGVETEILPDPLLPKVPSTKFVKRVECGDDALLIFDPLGRKFPVVWGHVMLIALGNVLVMETTRREKLREQSLSDHFFSSQTIYHRHQANPVTREVSYQEERRTRTQLEIVLTRGVARYSIQLDDCPDLLFRCLGERRKDDVVEDTRTLIRDIRRRAPHALSNRGAFLLDQGEGKIFDYPSKNAFFEEIRWMLWKSARAKESREGS